jgi:hypothetical protein
MSSHNKPEIQKDFYGLPEPGLRLNCLYNGTRTTCMMSGMSKPKKATAKPAAEKPAPESRGPVYNLRLSHAHASALAAFVNAQKVPPDRSQVFLKALEKFLAEDGFWPWPKEDASS